MRWGKIGNDKVREDERGRRRKELSREDRWRYGKWDEVRRSVNAIMFLRTIT